MASGKHIPCGPCSFDDVTKDAGRWCNKCEEGLCEECEKAHRRSKSSRNHEVISVEDYRKIEHVLISQVCEHHGENLEWFCKSHDEVLCVVCVPSKHKACPYVIPISVNSSNARHSTALSDLEETVEETLCDVKDCINNRYSAIKKIEKEELAVITMVLETRTKINDQLDKLQEQLLHELTSTSASCKSNYMEILQKLKSTEEILIKIKEQTIHMKQFSSNIQVFLGTRQVTKRISHQVESIKSEINAAKNYELKVSMHSLIEKLLNDVRDFGKINVSESATNLDFRDRKFDQAQIDINISTSRSISDIELQFIHSFQIKRESEIDISGCVILPNGNLLVASDTKENNLIEYSNLGEHIRDIHVSSSPFAIDVIDLDRIVVTYGDAFFIEILHTNTFNIEKKITLQKNCWGVSHAHGKLYVVHGDSIQVLDLSGRNIKTIKTASDNVIRICASRDRIVYSNFNNEKFYTCNLNGTELWQFGNGCMNFHRDMTVDNYNNIFVVSDSNDHFKIIQHDGKIFTTLLIESGGMIDLKPRILHFDKDKRTLVICTDEGKVLLNKVAYFHYNT